MAVAPKNLILPGKTDSQAPEFYKRDMRTIEEWCNNLKVGGASSGALNVVINVFPGTNGAWVPWNSVGNVSLTSGNIDAYLPMFGGDTGYPPNAFFSGTIVDIPIGGGGFFYVPGAATSHVIMSSFFMQAPSFTGGSSPTMAFSLELKAVQLATTVPSANAFTTIAAPQHLSSGQNHLFVAGDFPTHTIVGTDLTFASASLVTTGGLPYICSWNVLAVWDTSSTFTQA